MPGWMASLMTFYGVASLAYLLLGILWFFRSVKFWKDIIQLQYYISVVITLGMFEMALWCFEYANLNSSGRRPMKITLWSVTITAVKKTLSWLLLLVVSTGYGVMRPTLEKLQRKAWQNWRSIASLQILWQFLFCLVLLGLVLSDTSKQ